MSKQKALKEVSQKLGIDEKWLNNLIKFESNWNPKAKNPYSSARGLIQFMDSTAKTMGYKNSSDLIAKHPTVESQLKGPVLKYLSQFKPFPTKQSLYMSVFYPKARYWSLSSTFPDTVQKVNPGIVTVYDYVRKVEKIKNPVSIAVIAIAAIGYYLFTRMKG